jgi:hypothetical protein
MYKFNPFTGTFDNAGDLVYDANRQIILNRNTVPSASTINLDGLSGNVLEITGTTTVNNIEAPVQSTFLYLIGGASANFTISNTGNIRPVTLLSFQVTEGNVVKLIWNTTANYWEQVNVLASQFVNTSVYRTGRAYSIVGRGSYTLQTVQIPTTAMRAYPFILENDLGVSEMRINVTTGVASSFLRVGIYECDSSFYPTTPLFLSAEIDSSVVILKTIPTSSFSFIKNKYYAFTIQSSLPGVSVSAVDDSNVNMILGVDPNMGTNAFKNWTVNRAYAVLPNPFTAGGTLNSTDLPELIGLST